MAAHTHNSIQESTLSSLAYASSHSKQQNNIAHGSSTTHLPFLRLVNSTFIFILTTTACITTAPPTITSALPPFSRATSSTSLIGDSRHTDKKKKEPIRVAKILTLILTATMYMYTHWSLGWAGGRSSAWEAYINELLSFPARHFLKVREGVNPNISENGKSKNWLTQKQKRLVGMW